MFLLSVVMVIWLWAVQQRMNSEEEGYFCYLTVTDNAQFILSLVIIVLTLPLVGLGAYKFHQLRGSHNRSTAFVYSMLLLWWLTFVGSVSYAIFIYYNYLQPQEPPQSSSPASDINPIGTISDEDLSLRSKYLYMADWVNAYCVQLLMLYVPYRWCKNINMLFNGANPANDPARSSDVAFIPYTGIQTKIQPLLLLYIKIRFLELLLPVFFIVLGHPIFFKALFFCFLVDCLVVFLALLIGMVSLKTSTQLIDSIDADQRSRIFNQYLLMAIATVIRTGFDILFLISNVLNDIFYRSACPQSRSEDIDVGSIIFTIAVSFFGDFFPVFIILRIYTLEDKPQEMCQSLIITTAALNSRSEVQE